MNTDLVELAEVREWGVVRCESCQTYWARRFLISRTCPCCVLELLIRLKLELDPRFAHTLRSLR